MVLAASQHVQKRREKIQNWCPTGKHIRTCVTPLIGPILDALLSLHTAASPEGLQVGHRGPAGAEDIVNHPQAGASGFCSRAHSRLH